MTGHGQKPGPLRRQSGQQCRSTGLEPFQAHGQHLDSAGMKNRDRSAGI